MKFILSLFFSTEEGYRVSGIEALCITLERLAYLSRWRDLLEKYGRSSSNLSSVFYYVCKHLSTRCSLLLGVDWNRISPSLENFVSPVHVKEATLFNVWGFIDGPFGAFVAQGTVCSRELCTVGHRRSQGVKHQSITTPDGIIAHMYGPAEGCSCGEVDSKITDRE
ncbi:hypothetical protein PHMEG_00031216 [Phytophthora megakarya]|uniref:DDE Tnp4 domain-containing protein n=1 Tax=Phytophthora megakarya TaxID=4795 RepID=A0A225UYK8_9STRA|nr:hypothetical protein PHMEG_00031216 [Phytophthora megakarya]